MGNYRRIGILLSTKLRSDHHFFPGGCGGSRSHCSAFVNSRFCDIRKTVPFVSHVKITIRYAVLDQATGMSPLLKTLEIREEKIRRQAEQYRDAGVFAQPGGNGTIRWRSCGFREHPADLCGDHPFQFCRQGPVVSSNHTSQKFLNQGQSASRYRAAWNPSTCRPSPYNLQRLFLVVIQYVVQHHYQVCFFQPGGHLTHVGRVFERSSHRSG